MSFKYLIDKVQNTEFSSAPFKHLYIDDFFSEEHLREITEASEIQLEVASDDENLFASLFESGYKIIGFPGTITDKDRYIEWHKNKELSNVTNTACVGFGVVLRLEKPQSAIIDELNDFLASQDFQKAIAERYDIDLASCNYDAGIQKYLDGYEISPHPDVRRKALTYMVNINPSSNSHLEEIHTHYLKFNKAHSYIQSFWEGNEKIDRCWVPWDWCETSLKQTTNNSFVLFSPGNDTMHAVKASYDHLKFQRTQLYGNLWYANPEKTIPCKWEDLVIEGSPIQGERGLRAGIKKLIPAPIFNQLKGVKERMSAKKNSNIGKRDY